VAADTVRGMRPDRLLTRIVRGDVGNVDLADLMRLLEALGFTQIGGRGSHRVFARTGVTEYVNIQDDGGGQAKRYQVRQVVTLIRRYDLHLEEDR
jgi:predicted RNA binding protein YcfA (HicA-like mRNA interferase family)